MSIFKQKNRLIAWLAMLAILLNALAPSVSHALAASNKQSVPWLEICSVSGIKYISLAVSVKDDKTNKSDSNSNPNGDKSLCLLRHACQLLCSVY